MSMKNPPVPGGPAPRSGHGAASVIPHLEEDNARVHPSSFNEQDAQEHPEASGGPESVEEPEHPGTSE